MTSIVAIVEGMEISLLKSFISSGKLPWFENAFQSQSLTELHSGSIPYEPPHLLSAFTGVSPEYHGCFSYWHIHETIDNKPRVLNSKDVFVPPLWHWDHLSDLRFAVVNIALTHPPEPLNGYLMSYLMQQSLRASYPTNLQHELSQKGIRFAHDVSAFYRGEPADQFVPKLFKIAQYQLDTALTLADRADLLIFNLTIADRLSHFYWSDVENNPIEQSHLFKAYVFLDQALQALENKMKLNDFMLTFSEIGFGGLDYFVSIDDYLFTEKLQSRDSQGNIIQDHSIARETVQGSHGINIITQEKDLIERLTTSEYSEKSQFVIEKLSQFKFNDRSPVFSNVYSRHDYYENGPYQHLSPDIIVIPNNLRRPPLGDRRWANHVNRHLQTGWHRPGGFCFYQGPKTVLPSYNQIGDVKQIAPTIATLLNQKTPHYCQSSPLFFSEMNPVNVIT